MKLPESKLAEQLFKKFCEVYKSRDLSAVLALFTRDINMWGTAIDEHRVGLKQVEEQLKRDWSQSEAGEIHVVSFIPAPADALWAAAVCQAKVTIDGQQHIFEPLRGTLTIAKEEGVWKIAHMHASFPDRQTAENSSFPGR